MTGISMAEKPPSQGPNSNKDAFRAREGAPPPASGMGTSICSFPWSGEGQAISWLPASGELPNIDAAHRASQEAALGDTLKAQGQLDHALQRYIEATRLQPENARLHVKAAMCAWKLMHLEMALHHLERAVQATPDAAEPRILLADLLCDLGQLPDALAHSEVAMRLAPGDPDIAVFRARILQHDRQTQAAWQLVDPLIRSGYRSARLAELYAWMSPKLKREEDALAYVRNLLASGQVRPDARVSLDFAVVRLLDRLGRYDEAFEHARKGKQASRRPFDPRHVTDWFTFQINYFTPAKLHDLPRASHRSRRPIFIVGMPRSGTTLVEQILASHPQVHGGGELRTLGQLARGGAREQDWSQPEPYPAYLDGISLRKANEMAQAYLSTLSKLNDTATYVTDKMPDNFIHLGLIAMLFPECNVIHCTRDPLDTCLSCFLTFFQGGQAYTHDLTHLGQFYRDYRRLMAHWNKTLNIPMIEINYETLVNDLEGQTRRLLEMLGLPWDDQCLRFHENRRSVRTASWEQVRQPLYQSSVGRWKRYEKHLGPLINALGEYGTR